MPSSTHSSIQLLQSGELPLVHVTNKHASALIALQGAQILSYTATGQRPLLWLSEQVEFRRGQPMRGGIPICWPWFGDIGRNPPAVQKMATTGTTSAHGFVRAMDWSLHSIDDREDATDIVLQYSTATASASALWPHAAALQLTIGVGKSLRVQLTTSSQDTKPLAITQALHTYFAISNIARIAIEGFDGCRYIDTLDQWREHQQRGNIRFGSEIDRIYLDTPAETRLRDVDWQRIIHLRANNSASAVVWNPWIEKSQRLSQFAADAWQRTVCIETANVLSNRLIVAPGTEHVLELELWSESL